MAAESLEQICTALINELSGGRVLDLVIPRRDNLSDALNEHEMDVGGEIRSVSLLTDPEHYAKILTVVGQVAELVAMSKTISQRDVYYSHKSIFNNQTDCNRIIIEVGLLLGLRRHEMNIIPATRGFVAGFLRVKFNPTESWTDCLTSVADGGLAISAAWTSCEINSLTTDIGPAKCIIVIEKLGIFHRLCEDNFHLYPHTYYYHLTNVIINAILRKYPSVIICGAGFPDIATRALVSKLSHIYSV
jgi:DNA topoisomerase VI subunit A